jgi:hypothetical protein
LLYFRTYCFVITFLFSLKYAPLASDYNVPANQFASSFLSLSFRSLRRRRGSPCLEVSSHLLSLLAMLSKESGAMAAAVNVGFAALVWIRTRKEEE